MDNNIVDMEEYLRIVDLKNKLDSKQISRDDISLEDLDNINNLYVKEIVNLEKDIDELKKENIRLKVLKGLDK